MQEVDKLSLAVNKRLIAILLHCMQFDPMADLPPRLHFARRDKVNAALAKLQILRVHGHDPHIVGCHLKCRQCSLSYHLRGAVAAVPTHACVVPDMDGFLPPGFLALKNVHASHPCREFRGITFCTSCGGFTVTISKTLSRPCTVAGVVGVEIKRAGRDVLRRLAKNLPPKSDVSFPPGF